MPKSRSLFLIVLICVAAIGSYAQHGTPVAAARSFYEFDRTHSDGLTRHSIDARRKWLSPELYSLFRNELRRQEAYLKKNPTNKPYFGDGLSFRPIDENCGTGGEGSGRRLTIKRAFQKGNRAAVTATFAYPKPCPSPDATTYTIGLIRGQTGWLIDDVNYGDKSTLKTDLKRKEY